LPGVAENHWPVHVSIAMHHAEPDELGLFESRNQPQHARLLAPFDLGLKADEAEMIACEVVLPELHGGVRFATAPRVDEADGFHRAESQCVNASMGHDFDRQAPLEEFLLVE